MRCFTLAIVAALCTAPASAKDRYEKLQALNVDQFARKMEKRDDDLTTSVLFSTESGYKKRQTSGGWLMGFESDLFLKASIDKKTHIPTYLVMAHVGWIGSYAIWRNATFTMPDGPQDADVLDGASARMSACVSLGCSYEASIGLEVSEATLRAVAASGTLWRFRFRSTGGAEFEDAIAPVEAQAILDAVAQSKMTV